MLKMNLLENMQEDQSPNFLSVEDKVFTEYKGEIYIGREKIKPEILDVLKEQARYFKTSNLYEVLRSTIINEAHNAALIQSKNYEEVMSSKMLYHWQFVLDNIIHKLTKS